MSDIFTGMDEILQNESPERHTFFQLKFFILGSEPTIQAKLQCCIRELRSRRTSLENIQMEVEDLKDKKDIMRLELEKISIQSSDSDDETEYLEKEKEIKLRSLRRKIRANEKQFLELQKKFKNIMEECQLFVTAFHELEEEEKLKPWDSLEVQEEYWNAKLGKEFRTRLILGQPIDNELVKAIECLPDEANTKQQMLQLIKKQEDFNKKHNLPSLASEVNFHGFGGELSPSL